MSTRRRNDPREAAIFCPWCGQPTAMDYAHGHAQCVHCKTNIAPCCDGETAAATCVPRRATDAPRRRGG